MTYRTWLVTMLFSTLLASAPASGLQTSTATSNPQAVSLANLALAALVGSSQVSDVTLTGTATWTAGSDIETGNITLKALGPGDSRFDLNSPSGTRSEVRNLTNGPGGFWIGLDGTSHAMAAHNCMTDAAWFFPPLSVLSQLSNPSLVASYVGPETKAGEPVYHLHFAFQSANDTTGMPQRLTAEDVYLDASSYLPVAVLFNAHPDNDALTNIAVEVDYSNYQAANGIRIPFHVQKLLNGSLFLDITIQSAVVNSGLTGSDFSQ